MKEEKNEHFFIFSTKMNSDENKVLVKEWIEKHVVMDMPVDWISFGGLYSSEVRVRFDREKLACPKDIDQLFSTLCTNLGPVRGLFKGAFFFEPYYATYENGHFYRIITLRIVIVGVFVEFTLFIDGGFAFDEHDISHLASSFPLLQKLLVTDSERLNFWQVFDDESLEWKKIFETDRNNSICKVDDFWNPNKSFWI